MKIIGITGPTGAGKSLLSEYMRENGIPVIDADGVYHSLLVPPSPCLDAIKASFGDGVLSANGELDRRALSEIVFNDKEKLELLNSTVLGFVLDKARKILADHENEGYALAAVDAPTLIESGFDRECNIVVSVLSAPEIRVKRIMERDGIDRQAAETRVRAQKEDSFYTEYSDIVLVNNGDREGFLERCGGMLAELLEHSRKEKTDD